MSPFTRAFLVHGSIDDAVAALLLGLLAWLVWQLLSRPEAEPGFDARRAWLLAGLYFCACLLAGWASGVLSALLHGPLGSVPPGGGALFAVMLAAIVTYEFAAYWGVWRAGTRHFGRPLNPPYQLGFGALWGVCEGVLILSFWAAAEAFGASAPWAAVITFVAASAWLGFWHATYWDKKVVPAHNIPEWNVRKVLIAHVPNLALSLAFFAAYRSAAAVLMFQVIGLSGATLFMRFPAWNWSEPQPLRP